MSVHQSNKNSTTQTHIMWDEESVVQAQLNRKQHPHCRLHITSGVTAQNWKNIFYTALPQAPIAQLLSRNLQVFTDTISPADTCFHCLNYEIHHRNQILQVPIIVGNERLLVTKAHKAAKYRHQTMSKCKTLINNTTCTGLQFPNGRFTSPTIFWAIKLLGIVHMDNNI